MPLILTKARVFGCIGESPSASHAAEPPNIARIGFPIKSAKAHDSPGSGRNFSQRQTSWTINAHGEVKVQTPRPNLKTLRDNEKIEAAINMKGSQFLNFKNWPTLVLMAESYNWH